jgi:ribosomal protein S2
VPEEEYQHLGSSEEFEQQEEKDYAWKIVNDTKILDVNESLPKKKQAFNLLCSTVLMK